MQPASTEGCWEKCLNNVFLDIEEKDVHEILSLWEMLALACGIECYFFFPAWLLSWWCRWLLCSDARTLFLDERAFSTLFALYGWDSFIDKAHSSGAVGLSRSTKKLPSSSAEPRVPGIVDTTRATAYYKLNRRSGWGEKHCRTILYLKNWQNLPENQSWTAGQNELK